MDKAAVQQFQQAPVDDSERKALQAKIDAYNASLRNGSFNTAQDPFTAGGKAQHSTSTFSQAGEVVAIIKIDKLGLELPIYYGATDVVLAKGIGLLERTNFPGTVGGNAVLTGHRGTHDADMFRHLEKLVPGDTLYVIDKIHVMKYTVTGSKVVLPTQTEELRQVPGKDLVTLLTCDPYLVNTHRLLVFSERTPISDEEARRVAPQLFDKPATNPHRPLQLPRVPGADGILALAWLPLFVVAVALLRWWWLAARRRRRRRDEEEPPGEAREEEPSGEAR